MALTACGGASPSWGAAEPVAWRGRGPSSHDVHGIDVSRYQENVDWRRASANGVSSDFIKATEGGD